MGMTESERRKAINAYVRKRLVEECAAHGRASEIARATGFTKAFISYVIRGERTMGTQFVDALAAFWAMSFGDLERSAEELWRAENEKTTIPTRLPNLQATLEWCRGSFPDDFLNACEGRLAQESEDRPKRAWLAEIEAAVWPWSHAKQRQRAEMDPSGGTPLPSPHPYPTRKGAARAKDPKGGEHGRSPHKAKRRPKEAG